MSFLIFQEQAGDKLKLVADIDEVETATEAVDALVDALPKFGGEDFVVFDSEAREEVTAGQPIVRSVSKGGARKAAAPKAAASKPTRTRTTRKPAAAKSTPAKRTTRKPAAAKPAAKPAPKKPAAKPAPKARTTAKKPTAKPASLKTKATAGKKRGSKLKVNAASAE
jgi:hypothetical protein